MTSCDPDTEHPIQQSVYSSVVICVSVVMGTRINLAVIKMLSEALSREFMFPETVSQQWSIPRRCAKSAATALCHWYALNEALPRNGPFRFSGFLLLLTEYPPERVYRPLPSRSHMRHNILGKHEGISKVFIYLISIWKSVCIWKFLLPEISIQILLFALSHHGSSEMVHKVQAVPALFSCNAPNFNYLKLNFFFWKIQKLSFQYWVKYETKNPRPLSTTGYETYILRQLTNSFTNTQAREHCPGPRQLLRWKLMN
jgi:hypothetical protein